jgi:hypothetical protein
MTTTHCTHCKRPNLGVLWAKKKSNLRTWSAVATFVCVHALSSYVTSLYVTWKRLWVIRDTILLQECADSPALRPVACSLWRSSFRSLTPPLLLLWIYPPPPSGSTTCLLHHLPLWHPPLQSVLALSLPPSSTPVGSGTSVSLPQRTQRQKWLDDLKI